LGETGVGKMGEMPPRPLQELSRNAAAARPSVVIGARARATTAVNYIGAQMGAIGGSPPLIESEIDCGGS
jgi:hypothetical protein